MYGKDGFEFIIIVLGDGKFVMLVNGGMFGFFVFNCVVVCGFYEGVLVNGGIDEGVLGLCLFMFIVYVVYVCDLDGNKICVYSFIDEQVVYDFGVRRC